MNRYQKYIPDSAEEIKVSYDKTLGDMAEVLWDLFDKYELIKPKHHIGNDSEDVSKYWTFQTPEYSRKEQQELPEEIVPPLTAP